MGPLAPVSLFKLHSLFSPHLKWQLTAHQWSSMILGTIICFNPLVRVIKWWQVKLFPNFTRHHLITQIP